MSLHFRVILLASKDENKILGKIGSEKEEDLPTIVSSWKLHYKSWKNLGGLERKYILIKWLFKERIIQNYLMQFIPLFKKHIIQMPGR